MKGLDPKWKQHRACGAVVDMEKNQGEVCPVCGTLGRVDHITEKRLFDAYNHMLGDIRLLRKGRAQDMRRLAALEDGSIAND